MKTADAAKKGRSKSVIEAVENGNATNLQVLLQNACQDYHSIKKHDGHLELVRYLLSAGARPTREMACQAARGGHAALIHALVEGGLPEDIFIAAALGRGEVIRDQLDKTTSAASEVDSQGMTPLHYCCASSIWQSESNGRGQFLAASSLLLSAGADIHAGGAYHGLDGVTPLFYVAWTGGHPGIAHELIEHGAAITQHIFFAAVGHFQRHGDGNYEVAEVLLEHGFDINYCDERTALHAFASHEDLRGVTWLIKHGADVKAKDAEGNTPLMAAARRNSGVKVLRVLVEAGSSLTEENELGQTAFDQAKANGKAKAVEYLNLLNG